MKSNEKLIKTIMNTKKFLMLLAAVLLSCASAMAQSANSEPLKGDVNGDGIVDVADITAVIKIMKDGGGTNEKTTYYWYLGTQKLLTDTEIEANGTQITQKTDMPNTFTIKSEGYVYFYYPKAFGIARMTMSGLDVAGKDVMELSNVSLEKYYGWRFPKDCQGSEIHISLFKDNGTDYWYFGEQYPYGESYVEINGTATTQPITSLKVTNSSNFQYFAWPKIWGEPTFINTADGSEVTLKTTQEISNDWDYYSESLYNCRRFARNSGDMNLSISFNGKVYHWYVGTENPLTMSSISSVVDIYGEIISWNSGHETIKPGWRVIGSTLPTFSPSYKLFNGGLEAYGQKYIQLSKDTPQDMYIAIPAESTATIRDETGNDGINVGLCTKLPQTVILNGLEYKVYKWNGMALGMSYPIY